MNLPDDVFTLILEYAIGCPECGCTNHADGFSCALDNYSQYDGSLFWPDYWRLFYQTKSKFWGLKNWPDYPDSFMRDDADSPRYWGINF